MSDGSQSRLRPPPALWEKLRPLVREKRHEPTPAEKVLWAALRRNQVNGVTFRRQHALERFIVDFYCASAKLVIEVDGPIHDYTAEEDAIRQEFLEHLGMQVIRVTNDQVLNNLKEVIKLIQDALNQTQA
jgi:very-short-patch-repair endonuclease